MAELAPGKLIMNGRAGQHPWNPNRYAPYAFDFEVDLASGQHYTVDRINLWTLLSSCKGIHAI